MWMKFDKTKANIDCYNKNSYMEYLEFMKTPTVFGTEYDIIIRYFLHRSFPINKECVIVKNLCIMEICHKR